MPRREWFDSPDTSTPLSASMLNDLEARKPEIEHMVLNVKEEPFNAVGDSLTDDTAAIQAAINALPDTGNATTSGGVVYFPQGNYKTTAPLVVDGYNVTLRGEGSSWGGSRISPTTATTVGISAQSTTGFRLDQIGVVAADSAWTGTLVDLTGTVGTNTALFEITDCHLSAYVQAGSTVTLVKMPQAWGGDLRRNFFRGGKYGISGRDVVGDFSNGINVDSNLFYSQDIAAIVNPYYVWNIRGNTFEPLRSGIAGGILNTSGVPSFAVSLLGNWFGDASASGIWADMHGESICLVGNNFSIGGTGFKLSANSNGVTSIGNRFNGLTTGQNFTGSHGHMAVSGNYYTSCTTNISGTNFGTGSLVVDDDISLVRQNAGQIATTAELWLTGAAAKVLIQSLTAQSQFIMNVRASGDTQDSFALQGTGKMSWGSGSVAADVSLFRQGTTAPTLRTDVPFTLPTYTTATKPAAANVTAGSVIFVSDGGAGAVFQGSTGAAWVNLG